MSDATQLPKRKTRRLHTASIWGAIVVVNAALLFLLMALIPRVVGWCAGSRNRPSLSDFCDFRAIDTGLLLLVAVLLLIVVGFMSEHDPNKEIANFSDWRLWVKRPHHVLSASYRALRQPGTAHRRKTIATSLVWLIFSVSFFYIVAFAEIAF